VTFEALLIKVPGKLPLAQLIEQTKTKNYD